MVTKKHLTFLLLCVLLAVSACKKTDHYIEHEDKYVDGVNKIPPYNGVTTLQVSNYINKMNIDLLGVEPKDDTLDKDVAYLKENELSRQARITIINRMQASVKYYDRLFQVASSSMLNGMDRTEIEAIRDEQLFIKDYLYLTGDTVFGQIIENEVKKLNSLLSAQTDYQNGSIDIGEFYSRFATNSIYDEINMGSENFVISCFENLLKRYPTEEELANGVKMVDGQYSQVLLQGGNSKLDFTMIVVKSSDFYAGRIIDAFRSMLLRSPESDEMTSLLTTFYNSNNYETLLTDLLVTDEYAGF